MSTEDKRGNIYNRLVIQKDGTSLLIKLYCMNGNLSPGESR